MAELQTPGTTATLPETRAEWMRHAGVVSWGAVFAGAVAAAAFGLILLTLGTGLGLAAVSPWRAMSETASTFGVAAIVWICVTQVLTSGLGGYLAGRLRRRWPAVEPDEVYFRDTAHGFLTWAVATLATAALFASVIPAASKVGAQAVTQSAATKPLLDRGNAEAAANSWPLGYYADALFRQPVPAAESQTAAPATGEAAAGNPPPKDEVMRIFLNSLATGDALSAEDTGYVAYLVSQHTGLPQPAASARVSATYTQLQQKLASMQAAAKDAADKARKSGIRAALWLFISLLMGAFAASLMAVFGGRLRDL